jgi:hypothetical protein
MGMSLATERIISRKYATLMPNLGFEPGWVCSTTRNLTIRARLCLIFLHSNRLKIGLYNETQFPSLEGRLDFAENPIISLLPNQPRSNDEDIHEEFIIELILSLLHH